MNCNPSRLKRTSDGGYAFVNGSDPFSGSQNSVVAVDSAGDVKWYQSILMSPTDIIETADHGYMIVGLGPLYGVRGMSTSSNPQIGAVRTDSMGNGSCTFYYTLLTNPESFVEYPLSHTTSAVATVSNVQPVISPDLMVVDTGCVAFFGGFEEINKGDFISVYPNPASSRIYFAFAKPAGQYSLSIVNALGQEVYSRVLTGQETKNFTVDADFPQGMYVAVIHAENASFAKRILIE
jgi:hypothetical protein